MRLASVSWIGATFFAIFLFVIHVHRTQHSPLLVQVQNSLDLQLKDFQSLDKATCLSVNIQECERKCTKKKIHNGFIGHDDPTIIVLKGRRSGGGGGGRGGGGRRGGGSIPAPKNTPPNPDPECVEDCLYESCKFVN